MIHIETRTILSLNLIDLFPPLFVYFFLFHFEPDEVIAVVLFISMQISFETHSGMCVLVLKKMSVHQVSLIISPPCILFKELVFDKFTICSLMSAVGPTFMYLGINMQFAAVNFKALTVTSWFVDTQLNICNQSIRPVFIAFGQSNSSSLC